MSDQFSLFDAAVAEPYVPAAAVLCELVDPDGVVYHWPEPRNMTPDQIVRANEHWRTAGQWRPTVADEAGN